MSFDLFMHHYRGKKIAGLVIDDSPVLQELVDCIAGEIQRLERAETVRKVMDLTKQFLARQGCLDPIEYENDGQIHLASAMRRHNLSDRVWVVSTAIALASVDGLCGDIALVSGDDSVAPNIYCRLFRPTHDGKNEYCVMNPATSWIVFMKGDLDLDEAAVLTRLHFINLGDL